MLHSPGRGELPAILNSLKASVGRAESWIKYLPVGWILPNPNLDIYLQILSLSSVMRGKLFLYFTEGETDRIFKSVVLNS